LQIIADILSPCLHPQTKTYIRLQTNISYEVLQNCIYHLVLNHWPIRVTDRSGQNKLIIAEKELIFLEKWVELQKLSDAKQTNSEVTQKLKLEQVFARSK